MKPGQLWLASFACCPLAGWPLLAHASYRRFSLLCRFGLAAAAGSVLLSSWMTLFALAEIRWHVIPLVSLAALTAFLLRFLLVQEHGETLAAAEPAVTVPERLALAVSGISVLAAVAAAASSAATSTDLLSFWGPKAQAFAAARTIDAAFLRDPFLAYQHVSYPPLVTNLYAFASIVAGRFAWGAATLTFPLTLAILAISLPGALRPAAPRLIARAGAAFVICAFGFLGNELDVAGNADPWLWTFETLAMALLVSPAASSGAVQLLAGLLLAGAVTAKVEGLLFALASLPLFLLIRRKEIRIGRALVLLAVPSAVSLGAWFSFEAARLVFSGFEQYGRLLEVHWSRLPLVLSSIGHVLWSGGWALPYLLPAAALLLAPARTRLLWLPIGVSLALCLFSVFTYLHGDSDPLEWISWSAGRIFSVISAFLAIAAVCRRGASI